MTWEQISKNVFSNKFENGIECIFRGFNDKDSCIKIYEEFSDLAVCEKIKVFLDGSVNSKCEISLDCIEFDSNIKVGTRVSFSVDQSDVYAYYAVFFGDNCCRLEIDLE